MTFSDSDDDTLSQATYDASSQECDIFNRLKKSKPVKTAIRTPPRRHCRPRGNKADLASRNVFNTRLTFTLSGDLRPNPAIFAGHKPKVEL
ncbi:hypothetical protein KBY31_16215 [Ruegeria pomeroyi]|nr:hypothetical protein [Ruegeria pomeroyi]